MLPWIILLIIVAVTAVVLFILYRLGKKLQKRQEAANEQMAQVSQTVSMLVIDKKTMKMKEAGLPQAVIDQTPKYLRRSKVPIVKAKIGPKVMTLMCDPKIYELITVKKEVKAVVSGIYITNVKGIRTGLDKKPAKKTFGQKLAGMFKKNKQAQG
jgi:predicted Holliday junction resolvase-like endonuclease